MDLVDLLDRQYQYIHRLCGLDFLRQMPLFLRRIESDPRLRLHLEDVRGEADALVAGFDRHDMHLVPQLVSLRNEFVRIAPDLDDSSVGLPQPRGIPAKYAGTLAFFDKVAKGGSPRLGVPMYPRASEDTSRCGRLISILRGKFQELQTDCGIAGVGVSQGAPDQTGIDDLNRRLLNLATEHEYEHRKFLNEKQASPGCALLSLEYVIEQMNPAPTRVESAADFDQWINDQFIQVVEGLVPFLHSALYGEMDAGKEAALSGLTANLKPLVDRVYEDLRRRIGTVRSSRALLLRFKNRCEWHDRDRLRSIACKSKRPEDALVAELARWLFDQGLNPLTRPRTGSLEPDILDPSSRPNVYVEAKRYSGATGTSSIITRGIWQLHDTVMRLRGTPYEVDEAFYVVFRQGGPRYQLPETLLGEGWTTHVILVDIADTNVSGSRQRAPVICIPPNELLPSRS